MVSEDLHLRRFEIRAYKIYRIHTSTDSAKWVFWCLLIRFVQCCTVDVFATQESEHIENDELEIKKHPCARHLAFSDFIARYYAFKTHRAGNSSPKEDKGSTLKDTSKEAVYYSPFSRDFILSPPKKRWKCYLGNE